MAEKLDMHHKHVLRLIRRDANIDGWASISKPLFPILRKGMPTELVEFEGPDKDGRGRARLTETGSNVVDAMEWL